MKAPRNRWNRSAATAALIAGLLVSAPAQAQPEGGAAPPSRPSQAFDAVVLRPLGLAATLVGAALFVPAAILAAPGGRDSVEHAWDVFVGVPGNFAFRRPLGEF